MRSGRRVLVSRVPMIFTLNSLVLLTYLPFPSIATKLSELTATACSKLTASSRSEYRCLNHAFKLGKAGSKQH